MPPQKQPNSYIKYSNMALQMGITIGLGAWGGKKLDEYLHNTKPIFTAVLSLIGIAAGLYLVLKDFIKPQK